MNPERLQTIKEWPERARLALGSVIMRGLDAIGDRLEPFDIGGEEDD